MNAKRKIRRPSIGQLEAAASTLEEALQLADLDSLHTEALVVVSRWLRHEAEKAGRA